VRLTSCVSLPTLGMQWLRKHAPQPRIHAKVRMLNAGFFNALRIVSNKVCNATRRIFARNWCYKHFHIHKRHVDLVILTLKTLYEGTNG
jgi:hypothetical protein